MSAKSASKVSDKFCSSADKGLVAGEATASWVWRRNSMGSMAIKVSAINLSGVAKSCSGSMSVAPFLGFFK